MFSLPLCLCLPMFLSTLLSFFLKRLSLPLYLCLSPSIALLLSLLLNLYPEAAKRSGFAVSVSLSPSIALLVSLLLNLYHLDHVKLLIAQAINMIAHSCVCMGGGGGGREVKSSLVYTQSRM